MHLVGEVHTKITFVSSDPSIVSNEGNLLTGRKPGTVTMTATAENGVSASCEIKVLFTDVPETANITAIRYTGRRKTASPRDTVTAHSDRMKHA